MSSVSGCIVAWEKPPAGKIWRAFFDSGQKVYIHEEDVAKIETLSGGLPSVPLLVETSWLGRVKRWTAEAPSSPQPVSAIASDQRPAAYSESEWDTLCMVPFWIVTAVGLADGVVQDAELHALFRHMAHAESSPTRIGQTLFGELANNYEDWQARFFADERSADEGLQETGELLDRLDRDEAFDLRTQLFLLAGDVAAAHGPMTDQEKEAVIAVSAAIGLATSEA